MKSSSFQHGMLGKAMAASLLLWSVGCVGEIESQSNGDPAPNGNNGVQTTKPSVSNTSGQGGGGGMTSNTSPTGGGGGTSINTGGGMTSSTGGTDMGQGGGGMDSGMQEVDMAPQVAQFGELPPEEYARKVKYLIHGDALTNEELEQVNKDPASLKGLIAGWTNEPEFREKMRIFLADTLQQEYRPTAPSANGAIVSQLSGSDNTGRFSPPGQLHANLEQMFTRTVLKIIDDGRPFSEIATTSKWMMTTGVASYLLGADMLPKSRNERDKHTFYGPNSGLAGFDANTPLSKQIAEMTWYVGSYEENYRNRDECGKTLVNTGRAPGLSEIWSGNRCSKTPFTGPMKADDFSDWNEVEIKPLGNKTRLRYYDVTNIRRAVRQQKVLNLEMPRVGFFTTPAYFSKWRSNVDNSFRVTTNQALIIGLGHSFEPEGFTAPLTQEGVGEEHAEKGTACYGCHVSLDPMRNYFARTFDADFYSVAKPDEVTTDKASFGFMGHTVDTGSDMETFGRAIATHPLFAQGWVQKMCMFANSKGCDVTDPEFRRIEKAFKDSGLNFKTMVAELFSSPLITAAKRTKTHDKSVYFASISRRLHVCHALKVRMNNSGFEDFDPCSSRNRLAPAIPTDAWSRGATEAFQPAVSSLFYSASTETFCTIFANQIYNKPGSGLSADRDKESASLDFVVTTIMGVPTSDSRYTALRAMVQKHYDDGMAQTKDRGRTLRSSATLGCMSPFVSSIDF